MRHKVARTGIAALLTLAVSAGGVRAACDNCGDSFLIPPPETATASGGGASSGASGGSSGGSGVGGKVVGVAVGLLSGFLGSQNNKAVQAWTAHGKQMTANMETQTKAMTETREAQTQALSKTIRDSRRAEMNIRMAPPSLPCITPTLAKQFAAGEARRRAAELEVANALFAWGNNMEDETKGSSGAAALAQAARSLSTYCGPAEAEQGLCKEADPELQDANIQVQTIFRDSTLTGKRLAAAQDYAKLLTMAAPPARQSGDSYQSVSGMTQLSTRDSYDARISLAWKAISYVIALRSPSVELASWAEASMGEPVPNVDGQISLNAALETASVYRLRGDVWYNNMMAGPADAAWKDIATMRATKLYIENERFRLRQMRAQMLAALAAQKQQSMFDGNKSVATAVSIGAQ